MHTVSYFQFHMVCWRQSLRRAGLGFFQNLHRAIGHPNGLVIHTDACKGLEVAVDNVFPGVEHRECMRHLAANEEIQRKVV